MSTTNTYDVIVLGDDFAGLVAATLTARRGMRVLLAVTGSDVASYQLGPYLLPSRPLPCAGFAHAGMRRVLEELHFQHPLKRRLSPGERPFQFVCPSGRIDVGNDDVAMLRELEREFDHAEELLELCDEASELAEAIEPLFTQDLAVPPIGFWERREIARIEEPTLERAERWAQRVADNPIASALISAPGALTTSSDPSSLSPLAKARAFALWRSGSPRLRGDWQTLREIFLNKFASHNGEVRIVRAAEVSHSWGKITGIRLDDGEQLGTTQLVAAMPVDELCVLAGSKFEKKTRSVLEGLELAGYRYVLNLVVDEVGIPEGMAREVFAIADPSEELVGANALSIHIDEPDDEARVIVTIEAICPASDQPLDAAFSDLRVKIRERLEDVMPFLSEHVLVAHSPNETAAAEGLSGELELAEPVPALPVWRSTLESTLGISGLPYQLGLKNLTMATSQTLPGLGLEAPFIAGWCAARIVGGGGKKKDYLKDQIIDAG